MTSMPACAVRGFLARYDRLASARWARTAAALAFTAFIFAAEGDLASLPFTLLVGGVIAACAYLVSSRPAFALFVAASLLTISTAASMAKRKLLGVNVHVFDLWFYAGNAETWRFLWDEFRPLVLAAGLAVALFVALATIVWRRSAKVALAPLVAGGTTFSVVVAAPLALPAEADNLSYHNRLYHFASSFFVSLSDIPRFLAPSPIAQRLDRVPAQPPFPLQDECRPPAGAPDIILTLSESAVPPSAIPGWRHDPSLDAYFRSYDGVTRVARVETHGSGTWVTHTSVHSGVSMAEFGWMRPYATMLLRDRLGHGLPAALARCGYRTAVVSPQSYHFVSEGPMLTKLGFEDYIDRAKLNAPTKHEADAFYLGKALDYYKRHIATDGRPLFLFIVTMAAHSPYDFRFAPDRIARGEPFGNDPQTDEFLRRLTFAQEDYAAFLGDLRALGRPILAAQFGDHHPFITPQAFARARAPQAMDDWRSKLFETFYAVEPINFTPVAPLPNVPVLDLAYLGVTLMDTAGLPVDPVFAEKRELRALCEGAFFTCADRPAVDRHLARMRLSGYLREPSPQAKSDLAAPAAK